MCVAVVVVVVVAAVGILSLVTTPRCSASNDAPCSNNGLTTSFYSLPTIFCSVTSHKVLLRVQLF